MHQSYLLFIIYYMVRIVCSHLSLHFLHVKFLTVVKLELEYGIWNLKKRELARVTVNIEERVVGKPRQIRSKYIMTEIIIMTNKWSIKMITIYVHTIVGA